MTTPDILESVGFHKGKIGSDDKELGYTIKQTSLGSFLGSVVICFGVMALMVVSMVYEVRFEKKSIHRQLREEEHHAAAKLSQVQMELWSQYRADIRESSEANNLLKSMESSYTDFQGKFQGEVGNLAKEFKLDNVKANAFADKVLHLVADMQHDNVKHAKHLLDHLIAAGKKSANLETHVQKELEEGVAEEEKHVEEDTAAGEKIGNTAGALGNGTDEDPLKPMLEGFWGIYSDHTSEFNENNRKNFVKGNAVFDQLTTLWGKVSSGSPPPEEQVLEEVDKIDLNSIGAGLGSGRVLPVNDIIEELVMIPKIPHKELEALQEAWTKGEKDSVTVFAQLTLWHSQHVLPSGWLQMGVESEEKKEEGEVDPRHGL